MYCMLVTLEMSRLSGWLNAYAACREPKGANTVRCGLRAGRRETASDGGAIPGWGRARFQVGGSHGEERTPNMPLMVVTLEVSKLSG